MTLGEALETAAPELLQSTQRPIGLLKIDVERGEWDVIEGIDADLWARIRQVAMEVHDRHGGNESNATGAASGNLARIVGRLEQHGFRVAVEQTPELEGSDLFGVFAAKA